MILKSPTQKDQEYTLGSEADAIHTPCQTGWKDTFAGIRRCLEDLAD